MALMPIGKFSGATRLSVKTLRHYDEIGLLPAAYIDPHSGYRYYHLDQVGRGEVIRALRLVEMPLAEIAQVLDGDDADRVLASHLDALADQRDEYQRKLQRLQRLIARKELTLSTDVTVKTVPAQLIAGHRTTTDHRRIMTDIPEGFGIVVSALTSAGVTPMGTPFTMLHAMPDGDAEGDIEMCVPIAVDIAGDGVTVRNIDSTVVASIIHRGAYDDMGTSYASLTAWVHEHGHAITGPARELYLNDPREVAPDEILTEIQWPIDAEDAG